MVPGSAIVVTASLAGLVAMPLDPVYTLTKHAVVGFVRAVAPQLAECGITINALCPGFADTPIVDPELREWIDGQGIPLISAGDGRRRCARGGAFGRDRRGVGRPAGAGAARLRVPWGAGTAVKVFCTPEERFTGLPDFAFTPRYLEQDGLRMHYLDEGEGDPVLCLHGEPTWSFLYRKMIPTRLTAAARVVAPDYFGFGRSDKPEDADWYTFDRHCASIRRLVEELDLRRATVVVQDWGGPIGLRLAVEQPERVARLVILNTGVGGGRPPSEEWLRFRDVVRTSGGDFQPGRLIRTAAIRGLADEVVAAYDAPFPAAESKAGVLAFPEQVPTEPEHPNTAPLLAIREALASWEKPALVLFGDLDPIFRPEVADAIARWIPGALPAELVANAGHFVQEDAGEEVAARIVEFLR